MTGGLVTRYAGGAPCVRVRIRWGAWTGTFRSSMTAKGTLEEVRSLKATTW